MTKLREYDILYCMIPRIISIEKNLEKNKVLIIYGARQVGKTTLVNAFLSQTNLTYQFYSGDQLDIAHDFSRCELEVLKKMIGSAQLLVIDEAQKIERIGRALKLIVDHFPDIYVIATGSSSFDLANATAEPLTGRKNKVTLYPISIQELAQNQSSYNIEKQISNYLMYGMYPNIITYDTYDKKQNRITEITNSYLIKDILAFHKVKQSYLVMQLLKKLAFQIGQEVSTTELGQSLGLDHKTIQRYLDLLEKSFVIYRLNGFSRNLRSEINKMSKYYFYDLGIRNALISNFNELDTRNDVGQLWENFIIIERLKQNSYSKTAVNSYFWRTYSQQEIDLIEEKNGQLYAYEFKRNPKKVRPPKEWQRAYPDAMFSTISLTNWMQFLE